MKKLILTVVLFIVVVVTSIFVYAESSESSTTETNNVSINTSKFVFNASTENYLKETPTVSTSESNYTFTITNRVSDTSNENNVDLIMVLPDNTEDDGITYSVVSNGTYYKTTELEAVYTDSNVYTGIATYTNDSGVISSDMLSASRGNVLFTDVSLDDISLGITVTLSETINTNFYAIEHQDYNRYIKNENDLLALNSIKGHIATNEDMTVVAEPIFTELTELTDTKYSELADVSDDTSLNYDDTSADYYRNFYRKNQYGNYFWGDSHGSGAQYLFETNEGNFFLDKYEDFESDISESDITTEHYIYYEKTYVYTDIIDSLNYNEIFFLDDIVISEDNADETPESTDLDPIYTTTINLACSFHLLDNNLFLKSPLELHEYYATKISIDSIIPGNLGNQITSEVDDVIYSDARNLTIYAPNADITIGTVSGEENVSIDLSLTGYTIATYTASEVLSDIESAITRTIPINSIIDEEEYSIVENDVIFSKYFYDYDCTITYSLADKETLTTSENLALSPTGKVNSDITNTKLVLTYYIEVTLSIDIYTNDANLVDGETDVYYLEGTRNILVIASPVDTETEIEKEATYQDISDAYALEMEYFISEKYATDSESNEYLPYNLGVGKQSNVLSIAYKYDKDFVLSSDEVTITEDYYYYIINNSVNTVYVDGQTITVTLLYDETNNYSVTSTFQVLIQELSDEKKLANVKDQIYSILLNKSYSTYELTASELTTESDDDPDILKYAYALPNIDNDIFKEYDVYSVDYKFMYTESTDSTTYIELPNSYSSLDTDKSTAEYRFWRWGDSDTYDLNNTSTWDSSYDETTDYFTLFDTFDLPSDSKLYVQYSVKFTAESTAEKFEVSAAIPETGLGGSYNAEFISQLFKEFFESNQQIISLSDDDKTITVDDDNIYFSMGIYTEDMTTVSTITSTETEVGDTEETPVNWDVITSTDGNIYFTLTEIGVLGQGGHGYSLDITTNEIPLYDTTVYIRASISDNLESVDTTPGFKKTDETAYESTYQNYSFTIPGIISNTADGIPDLNLYNHLIEIGYDSLTSSDLQDYLLSSVQTQDYPGDAEDSDNPGNDLDGDSLEANDGILNLYSYNIDNPTETITSIQGLHFLGGTNKFNLSGFDLSNDLYKYLAIEDTTSEITDNKNITYLDLSNCNLSNVDLSGLKSLETINLSSNSLTVAPLLFRTVTTIDLQDNQITTIDNVSDYVGAVTIKLNDNTISSFRSLLTLSKLDLENVYIYGNTVSLNNSNSYYGTPDTLNTTGLVNFPVVVELWDLGINVYNNIDGTTLFDINIDSFTESAPRELHMLAVAINGILYFNNVEDTINIPKNMTYTIGQTIPSLTITNIYDSDDVIIHSTEETITIVDSTDGNYNVLSLADGNYSIIIRLATTNTDGTTIYVYRELFVEFIGGTV